MKDLPLLKRCVTNQNRSPRADSRADGGKETICPVVSQWSGWTTWDLTSSVSQNVWRRRAAGGAVDGYRISPVVAWWSVVSGLFQFPALQPLGVVRSAALAEKKGIGGQETSPGKFTFRNEKSLFGPRHS